MRRSLSLVSLFALLVGCGGTTPPNDVATDATLDAALDGSRDATSDAPPMDAPPACDAGMQPAGLPMLQSEVVIVDGDGGAGFPSGAGGDPQGSFQVDRVRLHLPSTAAGQVDTMMSRITGIGWADFSTDRYTLALDAELALATTVVGVVRRPVRFGTTGRYTVAGANVNLMPECALPMGGMGTIGQITFSRDTPMSGRLFIPLMSAMGESVLELTLTTRR